MVQVDNMGRFPFRTWTIKYLSAVGDTYASATVRELDRRYRRMDAVFRELYQKEKVASHNPLKLTPDDVLAYVGYLKKKGLKEKSISHNLTALNRLLSFAGNNSVQSFKVKYRSSNPKTRTVRYPGMEDEIYTQIMNNGLKVPGNDWKRIRAYALVSLALCAGMRTKELMFAEVRNLDLEDWTIRLDRVKGEGTYGVTRTIPIRPEAWPIIHRYVQARKQVLAELKASHNPYLFPAITPHRIPEGYISGNGLRTIKDVVQNEIGTEFDFRMCRRTYGQKAIDEGMNPDTVSLLLGHNTTKTTETYYCRKRPDVAVKEARELWEKNAIIEPNPKTIENKWEVTGYV
jgi:integrase